MALSEDQELRRRTYEELHAQALRTHAFYLDRWNENEAKVARYVSILLALLDAGTYSVPRLVVVLATPHAAWGCAFALTYLGFLGAGVTSLVYFLRALSIQGLMAPRTGAEDVVPFFQHNRYVDVLVAQARDYLDAASKARAHVERVAKDATRGYGSLIVTLLLGLLATGCYVMMELRAG